MIGPVVTSSGKLVGKRCPQVLPVVALLEYLIVFCWAFPAGRSASWRIIRLQALGASLPKKDPLLQLKPALLIIRGLYPLLSLTQIIPAAICNHSHHKKSLI